MRPEVDQLVAFSLVAETGSFSKTAQRLGVSKSLISRRISTLETSMGVRLLSRSTSFVALTPLGQAFNERVRRILNEIDDAVGFITDEMSMISGTVRIRTPSKFGIMYINPAVRELLSRHPQLNIELDLNDSAAETVSERVDFTICIGRLKDSDYIMKYFKPIKQMLVCSPDYLRRHKMPEQPDDILNHECVIFTDSDAPAHWSFKEEGRQKTIRPVGRLKSNNWEVITNAAVSGLGIGLLPTFIAKEAIERGELVALMPAFPVDELSLYALFPPNAILPVRVRTVIEFLSSRWRKPMLDPIARVQALPKVAGAA